MRFGRLKFIFAIGGVLIIIIAVAAGFLLSRQNNKNKDKIEEISAQFRRQSKTNVSAEIYEAILLIKKVDAQNREIIAEIPASAAYWNEYVLKISDGVKLEDGLELSGLKANDTIRVKTNEPISRTPSSAPQLLSPTFIELLENIDAAFWGR